METEVFEDWDPAGDIETKEDVFGALEAAAAENDPEFLLKVIGHVARSKGMAALARELGIDRAGLYRSLAAGGNPAFLTVAKALDIMGFRLNIELKKAS